VLKKERCVAVAPGGHFALAATEGGEAYSWGLSPHGELGSNHPLNMDDPQEPLTMHLLPPQETVALVSAGAFHGVAAMQSGRVFAWGCNGSNELGLSNVFTGDLRDCFYGAPVAVDALSTSPTPGLIGHRRHVVLVACGASHTVCVDKDGRVITWGCRDGGRLGRRDTAWPVEAVNPEDAAMDAKRRKPRPQGGAPPGEVEGLFDEARLRCVGVACGAWHSLLLCVPRDEAWDPDPEGTKARLKKEAQEALKAKLLGGGASDDDGDDGNGGGAGGGSPKKRHSTKKGKRKKKVKKEELNFGLGSGKRPGHVYSFGSGINGQLGLGDAHMAATPQRVKGLPPGGVLCVKAGTYVSAAADPDGNVWSWGSRGAGMFQPIPALCELPKGQRAGGLEDVACARDTLVFLTKGVGPEYFEQMVALKIAQFKKQREDDNAAFEAKLLLIAAEAEAQTLAKGEAFLRGAMARFRFARRAVKLYVNRKVVDPDTGRKRRVYVNLKTGKVLRQRPYFLKAYGMEPEREEEQAAVKVIQGCARRYLALKEAKVRALEVYEECLNPDGTLFWFNPRTGESMWTKPRWLD
jgi:alpha-tubulin suppressor-like RCC1 family protein